MSFSHINPAEPNLWFTNIQKDLGNRDPGQEIAQIVSQLDARRQTLDAQAEAQREAERLRQEGLPDEKSLTEEANLTDAALPPNDTVPSSLLENPIAPTSEATPSLTKADNLPQATQTTPIPNPATQPIEFPPQGTGRIADPSIGPLPPIPTPNQLVPGISSLPPGASPYRSSWLA